jgi:hypothetical protein
MCVYSALVWGGGGGVGMVGAEKRDVREMGWCIYSLKSVSQLFSLGSLKTMCMMDRSRVKSSIESTPLTALGNQAGAALVRRALS